MASENAKIDQNGRWTLTGITNDANEFIRNLRVNPVTGRLIVEAVVTSSNTGIGNTIPGGTQGSVLFLGPGSTLAEDNNNFFWDDTNNFLGLGTNTPLATLHVDGSARFDLGGDATGDVYYRDSSGFFVALPIGSVGDVLTVANTGIPSWQPGSSSSAYRTVQDDGTPVTQRQILNFVNFFTVTDNAVNMSTDVDINVSELANDTNFVDSLVNNTYFTTTLANDTNFITELTSNTTFQNNVVNIVNNDPTIQIDLATQVTGILPVPNGGTGAATLTGVLVGNGTSPITGTAIAQGDLFYGSAVNTLSALPKDTNATRYLSNTGTSNNPAWSQINLANGVTGTLALTNGGTGSSLSDPGSNKLWGWDDTDNAIGFWTLGSGLSYDHSTHTISASGSGFSQTSISKFDDFLGGKTEVLDSTINGAGIIGELNWTLGGDNSNGEVQFVNGTTGRPGVIRVSSSGLNDQVGLFLGYGNQVDVMNSAGTDFVTQTSNVTQTSIGPMNQGNWSIATSFFPSATTSIHMIVGLVVNNNLLDVTPTSGIYFELDTAVDGNWRGTCRSASTSSQTAGTVAATTSFKKFEIVMNSGGTSVEFFIDGVSLGTVSTNIPSTQGIPMYQFQQLSAAARSFDLDYWLMNMTVASR